MILHLLVSPPKVGSGASPSAAPAQAGVSIGLEIVERLASHPQFVALKEVSSAPAVAWIDVPRDTLSMEDEREPAFYRSSAKTRREFCPRCGSSLFALDDGSETASVTLTTMDDPSSVSPASHQHPDSAPSWLKLET